MRQALPEDADELEKLEIELFPDNCLNAMSLRRELRHGKCWVMEDKAGGIVGYALVRCDEGLVDILRLGVSREYRRSGLGHRLLVRVMQEQPRAMLMVRKDNVPALKLYKNTGFEITGEMNDSWVMETRACR